MEHSGFFHWTFQIFQLGSWIMFELLMQWPPKSLINEWSCPDKVFFSSRVCRDRSYTAGCLIPDKTIRGWSRYCRGIVQYFAPFLSVSLHRMAEAFNTDVESMQREVSMGRDASFWECMTLSGPVFFSVLCYVLCVFRKGVLLIYCKYWFY